MARKLDFRGEKHKNSRLWNGHHAGETPPSEYRRGYWDGFNIGKREGRIEAEDELAQQAEPVDTDCHTQGICQRSGYGITQQPEPVAWVECDGDLVWNNREAAIGRNLYISPQPQQTEPSQDTPTQHEYKVTANDDGTFSVGLPNGEELRIIPPQRPAEPVQEPVAWRWGYRSVTTGEMDWRGYVEIPAHPNLRSPEIIMQPLYTAPPQRKPLPKHDQHCVDVPGYGLVSVRLVRAVERAHGIKE